MVVGPVGWGQEALNVETLLEVSMALAYIVEALKACRSCITILYGLPLSMQ